MHGNPGNPTTFTSASSANPSGDDAIALGRATCTAIPSTSAECFSGGPRDAGCRGDSDPTPPDPVDSPGMTATRKTSSLTTP